MTVPHEGFFHAGRVVARNEPPASLDAGPWYVCCPQCAPNHLLLVAESREQARAALDAHRAKTS